MTPLGQLILDRLARLELKMDATREEIAALKVKSGIWGGLAGAVPVIVLILLNYV